LQKYFPHLAPSRVIANGIDCHFIQAKFPIQKKSIVYFGRLSRGKGVLELIEAWKALPLELREQFPLECIGAGELASDIRKLNQNSPSHSQVRLCGLAYGADLAQKVGEAGLVVLPSTSESFGNTMLEAIAMGHRIVTIQAGAIPSVVGPHADLLPTLSAHSLRELIEHRLKEWAPLSDAERGYRRAYVTQHYSWESVARAYLLCHEELRKLR
jgi:glycosyltransferase involved in cell wall biosynthesis